MQRVIQSGFLLSKPQQARLKATLMNNMSQQPLSFFPTFLPLISVP